MKHFHFCRRAQLQEQHGRSSCLWLCCRSNKGPLTQPSQQALRLLPIGIQLSLHFKGMLASLRASVHSFKSPAVGSERQTSHVFRTGVKTTARILERSRPKTSAPAVLLFCFTPRFGGSECSRSKPFPLDHQKGLTRGRSRTSFPSPGGLDSPCPPTSDMRRV